MMIKKTIQLLVTSALLVAFVPSPMALAEDIPWYQVEVILFSYKQADTSTEKWPDNPGRPDYSNSIKILGKEDYYPYDGEYLKALQTLPEKIRKLVPAAYTQLPPESLVLQNEAKNIRWSRARNLLLHTGWLFPAFDLKNAPAIQVQLGEKYSVTRPLSEPKVVTPPTIPPPGSPVTGTPGTTTPVTPTPGTADNNSNSTTAPTTPTVPSTGVDVLISETLNQVEGNIKISISRYLHVYTDFLAHRPEVVTDKIDPSKTESVIKAYRFKSHRRLRSKELHYIDNPLFGMLILFTPYKLPEVSDPKNKD